MNEPLAIVGMGCRLPGADGLDAFWELVVRGGTAWGPLPEARLPRDLYFHPEKSRLGKSYSEMGAITSDRPADPARCPVTPEMQEQFDVAHTIFLEVASQACRDAGMDPFAMPGDRRTGVFVGHTGGSTRIGNIVYATGIDEAAQLLGEIDAVRGLLGAEAEAVAAEVTAAVRTRYPGRAPGSKLDLGALAAAKIVQRALRLDGPYLVVDAACASSLQAMAIGARAVLEGSIDQAIVGGASYCKSDSLVLFSAAQSVSNTGSCPFGKDADGLVTAEGYVALVIKKLTRAVADGDRIRAVIRGLGVASDGKGKSLWAPRQEGQVLAVERAYPDAADISRIEYIEAHATSTQVGDATELSALARLMGRHLPPGKRIPIGSVKANIGHTLETAGIASLVKVVLAMEHGVIPPGTTATELNDTFDWQSGPFSVPREPLPWPAHADGSPRCAAVNAFGIGGLNVHVSLAEHLPAARPVAAAPRPARAVDADAVAIVGAGCVLPGALSLEAFFDLVDRGETAIGPVPADRWDATRAVDRAGPRTWHTTSDLGGFVRGFAYDWRRHKVPPKQVAAANPLQFMLLEAADAAILDAGGPQAGLDRMRTGVVVGTLFGGDFADQLQIGLRLPETRIILEAALRRRGVAAADVARVIELYEKKVLEKLPALVDETGSFTSSTLASRLTKTFDLMGGALALDAGDCSSVAALSAAVDMLRQGTCDAVLCAAGERCMDLMAFEGRSLAGLLADRPVSVLDGSRSGGDVAGEGAVVFVLKRLADARAAGNRIRGVIRGVKLAAGRSRDEAVARVVGAGLERAGVPAAAVRAVEVATAGGNAKAGGELKVLAAEYAAGPAPLAAGALDGLVGHLGAAAGAAGVLKLTRALERGRLPGSAATSTAAAIPGLSASAAPQPIPAVDAAGYRAGCVVVAQDEQAGEVILDNGLPVPGPAPSAASPVVAQPRSAPQPAAPPSGRPLVAAIFPGQGSQYTDMFRDLIAEVPAAADVLATLDADARAAGCETLPEIAWRPDNGLGTRIWDTQWAMYLGDLFAWRLLGSIGFAPDRVASHSFGEFPLLTACGAWSFADGARATRARAEAVERHGPRDGAMLSVIADRATVAAALEPFAGRAWLCAENAPEQFVVGGTARIVDAVEVLLESRGVKSKRLAVPSPFHTPLLAEAAERLATTIQALPIGPAGITALSSTTLGPLADAEAIRASLVRQMTEPVRWIDVVTRLYDEGVRTFVEVGPSAVLTGLARRIVATRPGATFLQFDHRGRASRENLERLRDQLAAAGCLRVQLIRPAAASVSPAAAGVVAFDATARRRQRNRAAAGSAEAARTTVAASPRAKGHGGNGRDSNGHHTKGHDTNGHGANGHDTNGHDASGQGANGHAANGHGGNGHGENGHGGNRHDAHGHRTNGHGGNAHGAVPGQGRPTTVTAGATSGAGATRANGAAAVVNRLAPVTGGASGGGETAESLEATVAALLAEAGLVVPLGADAIDRPVVREFLETVAELFDVAPTRWTAVLAAGSLADLCDVLAASGGKATWLRRDRVPNRPAAEAGELEGALVDFVVEQTGYPREIVELDADLESDLGIDSIRKAQLFGEIGQRYGLSAEAGVSLDDFTTLRHLLDYMLPRVGGGIAGRPQAAAVNGHAAAAVAASQAPAAGSGTPVGRTAAFLRGLELGQREAAAIRGWARQIVAADPVPPQTSLDREATDEIAGIAEGARVDAGVVAAAWRAPGLALGGYDLAIATTAAASGRPGLVGCFGRHADPAATRFSGAGLSGVLVGVRGLPGAVVGWNDAGLVAGVPHGGATDDPPGPLVERIVTTCRSLDDARLVLSQASRPPRGLLVAMADGAWQTDGGGALVPAGDLVRRADVGSVLVRVALADGGIAIGDAVAALTGEVVGGSHALSSACTWLAAAAGGAESGCPRGVDWLDGAAGLGGSWAVRPATVAAASGAVTVRYELELAPLGGGVEARSLAGQRIAILGTGDAAVAVAAAVRGRGGEPLPLDGVAAEDPEAASFALAQLEAAGAVRHLVVIAPTGEFRGGMSLAPAFAACRQWITMRARAGDLAGSTLTGVVRLDGGFGLVGTIGGAAGGGLAGLLKGVAREYPDVHVRVVDISPAEPAAELAAAVAAEMADGPGPVEVGRVAGRRVTVAVAAREPEASGSAPTALAPGAVWIVTGGARGVTAACARELGRRHGLTLVLVGSTRPVEVDPAWVGLSEPALRELKGATMLAAKQRGDDPRGAWRAVEKSLEIGRSLAALAAAGVTARYEACDLADAAAVRELVARVAREAGPVRGIVHGAGWESACRFEKKTLAGLAATVGPKCDGLANLLAAVSPSSLEVLVGFGSTSGRLGGHGQADYSLANDLLAKLIASERQRRPGLRAATFHWHAWDEVGMASRPESRFVLEQFGLKFMPLAEGVRRFIADVEAGLPAAEILVTEPAMVAHAGAVVPSAPAAAAAPPEPPPADAGSLVAAVDRGEQGTRIAFRLEPLADRFLIDHLQYGRPLLPAVMGAELLAQAATAAGACGRVGELRDFAVEWPLAFPTDESRTVQVAVGRPADGVVEAVGWAEAIGSDGRPTGRERVHFRGLVGTGPVEPIAAVVDEPPFPFNPMVYQEHAPLRHGPSFRTLEGLFLDRSGGWGRLRVPRGPDVSAPRGARGWTVPAALLDGCIVGCGVYSYILCGRRVEVPVRFDRLRIMAEARTGETCTARMRYRGQDARETVYDLVLFGDDGRPLLALDGLHMAVLVAERGPPA